MNTPTADLGAQIAEQRDKLAETVTSLADKIDTDQIRARAESGAAELLDNATDAHGRPKRGLIIGAIVTLGVLVLVRRLLS